MAEGVDGMFEGKDNFVRDPFRPEEFAVYFFFFLGGPPIVEYGVRAGIGNTEAWKGWGVDFLSTLFAEVGALEVGC